MLLLQLIWILFFCRRLFFTLCFVFLLSFLFFFLKLCPNSGSTVIVVGGGVCFVLGVLGWGEYWNRGK